ncbi:MAG: hypothetical protein KDI71_13885 [Xanthomonadales bacterium]|nr:hypothetical protein [Xanthomonadales bacterium]
MHDSTPRWQIDLEPDRPGQVSPALTLFLVGARCPFRCIYCDLGEGMLDHATPSGSLPAQIRAGIAAATTHCPTIKLYNAANFFDRRAVPPIDEGAIVEQVRAYGRVVVECHPRLIGDRMRRFGAQIDGMLEVAMGLESADPTVLAQLNKAMTLADYDRAAETILAAGHEHRAFVLIGAPTVPAEAVIESTVASARYAAGRGARLVSLIPLRPRPHPSVAMAAPTLAMVESVLEQALLEGLDACVLVDPWDLQNLRACAHCGPERIRRIEQMNLSGQIVAPIACDRCAGKP